MQLSADGCWRPHQGLNASNDHRFRWMIVRSNPEPAVVNLPDNQYGETADEYAKSFLRVAAKGSAMAGQQYSYEAQHLPKGRGIRPY
jgi:hypothetical protein